MASRGVIPGIVLLGALMALPAAAADQHRRGAGQRGERGGQQQAAPQPRGGERAAPRAAGPRSNEPPRQAEQRRDEGDRRAEAQRRYDAQPRYAPPRQPDRRNYDRRDDERTRAYDRAVPRAYERGVPYTGSRSYGYPYHGRIAPRIVRPTIVTVVPYRPYVYRPSWSLGVYYGSGNYYPYGYTPRGYYDPIPGRLYGGLRITGAPRDAQVFADGYYVGIVNDFDGIFQHLNLEAGPHHIEIDIPGGYPIAFDVDVRPGQTITYRADYAYRPY